MKFKLKLKKLKIPNFEGVKFYHTCDKTMIYTLGYYNKSKDSYTIVGYGNSYYLREEIISFFSEETWIKV